MRRGFDKAMGRITEMTDSVVDDELRQMAAAKAPPPVASEGEMEEPEPDELTPDEVAQLRAMLNSEG